MIDVLSDLFVLRGVPGCIRSDNGPEFVAKAVQELIAAVGAKTAYITPGSPWENGYVESFNARLRDELLCSMAKSSTLCERPKSSSKVGGATSTQSGRMNCSATSHQHRKCSCQPSPRGRLRYVDRLRRPRWRNGQLSTNIPPGPLDGGRSETLVNVVFNWVPMPSTAATITIESPAAIRAYSMAVAADSLARKAWSFRVIVQVSLPSVKHW